MKYIVSLEGQDLEVEVDGSLVRVAGREVEASLVPVAGTPVRQLQLDGHSWMLRVEPAARGEWTVGWRGDHWDVAVVDERTRHIQQLTGTGRGRSAGGVLKAPMPGLVVRVLVDPGQAVVAGQGVVVLEAMKMENELKAPADGVVGKVLVAPGVAVEKGQGLVELAVAS